MAFPGRRWVEGQVWELEPGWDEYSILYHLGQLQPFCKLGRSGKKYLGVWRMGRRAGVPVSPHTTVPHSPSIVEQKLFHTRECVKV